MTFWVVWRKVMLFVDLYQHSWRRQVTCQFDGIKPRSCLRNSSSCPAKTSLPHPSKFLQVIVTISLKDDSFLLGCAFFCSYLQNSLLQVVPLLSGSTTSVMLNHASHHSHVMSRRDGSGLSSTSSGWPGYKVAVLFRRDTSKDVLSAKEVMMACDCLNKQSSMCLIC